MTYDRTITAASVRGATIYSDGEIELASNLYDETGQAVEVTRSLTISELESLLAEAKAHVGVCNWLNTGVSQ